jgi:SAM-dependent methyltransferase
VPIAVGTLSTFLTRLADFAEPGPDDDALDLCYGPGPLASALAPRVGRLTSADLSPGAGSLERKPIALPHPDRSFSLVTARFTLLRMADPVAALREMLRVCRPSGRVVLAELARTNCSSDDRDALERVRDPSFRATPRIGELVAMVESAGARVPRLDLLAVERPAEPWLAAASDPRIAERLREILLAELDGGPSTGARPRFIGGELWFTQTWAHLAARPVQD